MNIRAIVPVPRTGRGMARQSSSLFESLQQEVDRLFEDFSRGTGNGAMQLMPNMDVAETDKNIELTVELPGLEQADVDISINDNVLIIRGEKKAESERKDKNFHLIERAYGTFYRAFELPQGVDPSQIMATMSNGVLKVTIPKPAQAEPRKIEVKQQSESNAPSNGQAGGQSNNQSGSPSESQQQSRAQSKSQAKPQQSQPQA
jgi:HSP20 family protein